MTKEHDTQALRLATSKNQQWQLKVREAYHSYQLSQNCCQRTPIMEVHLKGHWLIKAGVEIDSPVKVRVTEGCLVLTSEPISACPIYYFLNRFLKRSSPLKVTPG